MPACSVAASARGVGWAGVGVFEAVLWKPRKRGISRSVSVSVSVSVSLCLCLSLSRSLSLSLVLSLSSLYPLFIRPLARTDKSDPSVSARLPAHRVALARTAGTLPPYVADPAPSKPYYIPFRALTSDGADNLLVAGKTMATTFSANSATRLHPEEWSSGVAAGAAAALLGAHACPGGRAGRGGSACGVVGFNSTRQLATGEGLAALLRLLGSTGIQQPLDWGV